MAMTEDQIDRVRRMVGECEQFADVGKNIRTHLVHGMHADTIGLVAANGGGYAIDALALRALLDERERLIAALSAPPADAVRVLPPDIDRIADGLANFLAHSGGLHDADCPGDDTCECWYAAENRAANDAAKLLAKLAALRAPVEAPAPETGGGQ